MIQGTVESVRKDGTAFKLNNVWYNIQNPMDLPAYKQQVAFEFQQDQNGQAWAYNVQKGQIMQDQGGGGRGGFRRGGGGGGGRQKSPRDTYGPIVGHNLLIAATVLPQGSSPAELANYARELMRVSEALLQETINQQGQAQGQQMQPQMQPPQQGFQQPMQGMQQSPQGFMQPPQHMQQAPGVNQGRGYGGSTGQPSPTQTQVGGQTNNPGFDDDIPW